MASNSELNNSSFHSARSSFSSRRMSNAGYVQGNTLGTNKKSRTYSMRLLTHTLSNRSVGGTRRAILPSLFKGVIEYNESKNSSIYNESKNSSINNESKKSSKKRFKIISKCADGSQGNSKILSLPFESGSCSLVVLNICGDNASVLKISNTNYTDRQQLKATKTVKPEILEALREMFSNIKPGYENDGCYLNDSIKFTNSLITEISAYKYLNRFIKYNISPHIVQFYGAEYMKYSDLIKQEKYKPVLKSNKSFFSFSRKPQQPPSPQPLVLIPDFECDRNNKLKADTIFVVQNTQFDINKKIISYADLLKIITDDYAKFDDIDRKIAQLIMPIIIFQVLYTLECFDAVNFRHNDLHPGNILLYIDIYEQLPEDVDFTIWEFIKDNFVRMLKRSEYMSYTLKDNNGNPIELKVPYMGITAKIYDFDLSSKYKSSYDDDEFSSFSTINIIGKPNDYIFNFGYAYFDKKNLYDRYKFLSSIYNFLDEKGCGEVIKDIIYKSPVTHNDIKKLYNLKSNKTNKTNNTNNTKKTGTKKPEITIDADVTKMYAVNPIDPKTGLVFNKYFTNVFASEKLYNYYVQYITYTNESNMKYVLQIDNDKIFNDIHYIFEKINKGYIECCSSFGICKDSTVQLEKKLDAYSIFNINEKLKGLISGRRRDGGLEFVENHVPSDDNSIVGVSNSENENENNVDNLTESLKVL